MKVSKNRNINVEQSLEVAKSIDEKLVDSDYDYGDEDCGGGFSEVAL